jgi:hypothetical protein
VEGGLSHSSNTSKELSIILSLILTSAPIKSPPRRTGGDTTLQKATRAKAAQADESSKSEGFCCKKEKRFALCYMTIMQN